MNVRRPRSVTATLLGIVLGLEAALVFFLMLVAYGLRAVPAEVAFGGGAALLLITILAATLVGRPAGLALAWAIQAALVALGFLVPLMFLIGAGFSAMFIYYFVKGRQIDRQKAAQAAAGTDQGEQ